VQQLIDGSTNKLVSSSSILFYKSFLNFAPYKIALLMVKTINWPALLFFKLVRKFCST
jgi:hypothetical protein